MFTGSWKNAEFEFWIPFTSFYWASARQFFDGPSTSNRRILQSTSHTRSRPSSKSILSDSGWESEATWREKKIREILWSDRNTNSTVKVQTYSNWHKLNHCTSNSCLYFDITSYVTAVGVQCKCTSKKINAACELSCWHQFDDSMTSIRRLFFNFLFCSKSLLWSFCCFWGLKCQTFWATSFGFGVDK